MSAGPLDRRATIEAPTTTRDAYGATVPGWTPIATVWAGVRALVPREIRLDAAQVSTLAHQVTIYYRSDVTPACRVTVDGKTLLVRGVSEIGRRQLLQLLCEQVI